MKDVYYKENVERFVKSVDNMGWKPQKLEEIKLILKNEYLDECKEYKDKVLIKRKE